MTVTDMPLIDDLVFGVAYGAPQPVDLFAPSCEQAWELMRVRLTELVADAERAGSASLLALQVALADLDTEGPQPYGWWAEVDGTELWYGPRLVSRPQELSVGEAALLMAVTGLGSPQLSMR